MKLRHSSLAVLLAVVTVAAAGMSGDPAMSTSSSSNWRTRSAIVFTGIGPRSNQDLLIMDGDGSNRRQVLPDRAGSNGVLSPDGTLVAYVAALPIETGVRTLYSQQAGLFVVPLAGGTPRLVVRSPKLLVGSPDWSPDGTRLLFDVPGVDTEIWTVDLDGSNAQLVTTGRRPRWAPGGGGFLFTGNAGTGVFVADASGRNRRQIVSSDESPAVTEPSWSPDGRIVARRGDVAIEVMDGDGTNRHVVYTATERVNEPTWSPDGHSIAFARNISGRTSIWAMRPDGSNLVRLSADGEDVHPRYPSFGA